MNQEQQEARGRAVMDRLESELRPILLAWDPFGASSPPDEYDRMFAPLLAKLRTEPTPDELSEWLGAFWSLAGNPKADREAAHAILEWWDEARDELPRGVDERRSNPRLP